MFLAVIRHAGTKLLLKHQIRSPLVIVRMIERTDNDAVEQLKEKRKMKKEFKTKRGFVCFLEICYLMILFMFG